MWRWQKDKRGRTHERGRVGYEKGRGEYERGRWGDGMPDQRRLISLFSYSFSFLFLFSSPTGLQHKRDTGYESNSPGGETRGR